MADPTARTLALLALLQTHRHWSGADLADRLDVSERTVRRDVDRLRSLGYEVDAVPGVSGGYQLAAGNRLPPLLIDDDEAVALAVGLRSVATAPITGVEDAVVGVMTKLEQTLPDRIRRRVESLHANVSVLRWSPPTETVSANVLVIAAQACRDLEELRFDYRRRDGEESRRLVRPHELVIVGRRWYLVAWDVRREDWRTFRVDRMWEPILAGARFSPLVLPAADAPTFVAQSLAAARPPTVECTVVLTGPDHEIADLQHWLHVAVEPLGTGRSRVVLTADDDRWAASMIAMLAARFPVELIDVADATRTALAEASRRLSGVGGHGIDAGSVDAGSVDAG